VAVLLIIAWQASIALLRYGQTLAAGEEAIAGPSLFAASDERLKNALGEFYPSFLRLDEILPEHAVIIRQSPATLFAADEEAMRLHLFALQLRHLLYPRQIRDLQDPLGAVEKAVLDPSTEYYLLRMQRGQQPGEGSPWRLGYSDAFCELYALERD
jgi:hypothetical protein